jgi:hypothetical protein
MKFILVLVGVRVELPHPVVGQLIRHFSLLWYGI